MEGNAVSRGLVLSTLKTNDRNISFAANAMIHRPAQKISTWAAVLQLMLMDNDYKYQVMKT
jgi:hypothetical protein